MFNKPQRYPWQSLAAVCLSLLFSPTAKSETLQFDSQIRQWTDSSGQFQIQARLHGYADRTLALETVDGRIVTLSIDRICRTDQAYTINQLRAARRQASGAEERPRRAETPTHSTSDTQTLAPTAPARELKQVGNPGTKYGISWWPEQDSLRIATVVDKPIYWFRVLGDLSGFM